MVKKENPKKIEKGKIQKKIKKIEKPKKIRKRKKKNLFSVVLDKICVFFLYPIPDSQQYVKRGSCRRPIFFGLLRRFSLLGLEPICGEVRIWASNLVLFIYLFYRVFESFCMSYSLCVYFVSNRYLSLSVMLCRFVSCHVFSY